MSDNATFHAAFEGASVTVKIDYTQIGKNKGVAEILKYEWEGRPTQKLFPQYVAWMHTVMSQIAKKIDQEILYAYPTSDRGTPLFFVYHRDGTFEKTEPPR